MSLKNKIATILVSIMVISSITFYCVFKLIVFKSFVEAENNDAEHDMHQCIFALRLEIKHFDRFVHDWSSWDDAYKFATDGNQNFIKDNLNWTEFHDQSLNLIHFYDRDGKLVWGKTFDLKTRKEIPFDLAKELNSSLFHRLIIEQNSESLTNGIIQTSIGPMMVAERPILTSENKGPVHGTLIMGRLFTNELLSALSEQVGVNLKAWPVGEVQMPKALRELMPSLKDSDSVRLTYASSDILHVYSIIKDLNNQPGILMESSYPRNITHKGKRAYELGMIFILGAGLLVFVSISGLLGTYILKPIATLTENAQAIEVSTKNLRGFETNRKDEIGVLSREFAAMLERLSKSEERYRIVADNVHDVIWIFDMNLDYTFVTPSVQRLRGYTVKEALKQTIDQILTPESYQKAKAIIDREFALELSGQLHGPEWSLTSELKMNRKDGSTVWAEATINILYNDTGEPTGIIGVSRDITERKLTEKALTESRNYLDKIINSVADPLFVKDRKHRWVLLNDAYCNFMVHAREELIGKSDYDFFPKGEAYIFWEKDEAVFNSRKENNNEESFTDAKGVVHTIVTKKTLYTDDKGEKFIVGIIRDITERKQAEEIIRKSEERYRTIFENTGNASTLFGEDTTILLANTNFEKLSGYSRQQVEGKMSWTDFVDKEDLEKMRRYHELRRKEPCSTPEAYEFRFINRKGEKRDIILNITLIPGTDVRVASLIDITERKRAEVALQESEMRFKALAENSVDTIMRFDRQHRHLYVNPRVQNETDIKPELFIGKTHREMGFPEDLCILWENAINKVFETGEVNRLEFLLPKGIWIDWILVPETDVQGRVVAVIASARDITHRKQAEEALMESERHLSAIIEFLPDATMVIDKHGRVTAWNKALEDMTGYSSGDMIGKGDYEYAVPFYGERRPILIDLVLMPKEEVEKKYYHIRRNGDLLVGETDVPVVRGQKRFLSAWAQPIYDTSGEIVGAIECIRDITDKRRAEEALEESEIRYRLLAENAYDIIFTMDKDLRFTYISPSVERIRGFTVEEAMKQNLAEILTPASLEVAMKTFHEELEIEARESKELWRKRTLELEAICKDDFIIWIETTFTPLRDKEMKFIGFLGITRDITERKKAEEEKKRLESQLIQAQKMESVGRLAGGVAHDYNNMLSVIIGNTEMAMASVTPSDPLYNVLQEILKAGSRSADLTRQLLAFARKQTVNPKVLDLNDTVSGMLKILRRLIGEDIHLGWYPGNTLWKVKIDPSQIDQILANLTVNARDAIAGVGKVTIETSNTVLDDSHSAIHPECIPGEYIMLAVSDDGCGMDRDTMANIFEPFFTTKELGKGTGLGLSTVYGIVKQNGGFVYVYSQPGQGTTFRIYLPRYRAEVLEADEEREDLKVQGGTETVLIVEDDESVLKISKNMLEKLGYRVLAVKEPVQAIHQVEGFEGNIDLLLIDIVMPGMNGKELAERLISVKPGLKCLYMSGYTADVIAHHGILDEGVHFISKPFSLKAMAEKVRETLG